MLPTQDNQLTHVDLFSGIGGFAIAARWAGWQTTQFVEIDPFCQKVLTKNFPNIPIHGDIKTFDGTELRESVDVITGGFPCQPHSVADRRQGKEDDRYLWPEMLRVINDVRPTFIVGENVSGSFELVDEICTDLELLGYTAEPISIEAASVGADHKRERIWYLAYSNGFRLQRCEFGMQEAENERTFNAPVFSPLSFQREKTKDHIPKPIVVGGIDGIPNRAHRTKSLGNAIVPQVAYEIFKAINLTLCNPPLTD